MGPGMEEAGGWVDGGTGTAAPGVRARGKRGGEKEQRESPRFLFPTFYLDFAGRGEGTPKPPLLSPSEPAAGRWGAGGGCRWAGNASGTGADSLKPGCMPRFFSLFCLLLF